MGRVITGAGLSEELRNEMISNLNLHELENDHMNWAVLRIRSLSVLFVILCPFGSLLNY